MLVRSSFFWESCAPFSRFPSPTRTVCACTVRLTDENVERENGSKIEEKLPHRRPETCGPAASVARKASHAAILGSWGNATTVPVATATVALLRKLVHLVAFVDCGTVRFERGLAVPGFSREGKDFAVVSLLLCGWFANGKGVRTGKGNKKKMLL